MPQGSKDAYTGKQKRKAEHIEQGYKQRGVDPREAESRAWATVNKQDGGGNKRGSGRAPKSTSGMPVSGGLAPGPRPAGLPRGC